MQIRVSVSLRFAITALVCLVFAFAARADAPPGDTPLTETFSGTITKISPGDASIGVSFTDAQAQTFTVTDTALQARFADAIPGDTINFQAQGGGITAITSISRAVPVFIRLVALVGCGAVLYAIVALLTGGTPNKLLIGQDNRYSNSQCQLALWFGSVALVYTTAVVLRLCVLHWNFIGGVNLPQNLMILTGLSAFTFGGAKAITASKTQGITTPTPPAGEQDNSAPPADPPPAAPVATAPDPKNPKPAATSPPNLLNDLTKNDKGDFDIGDLQMMLVVAGAVTIFLISSFHFLGALTLDQQVTLPDVDSAMLSGFGLGQGAYLFKKAALPAGQG